MKKERIALLGAGSWGTAIAIHLARAGHEIMLWGHNAKDLAEIEKARCNMHYLPEVNFPDSLRTEANLKKCLTEAGYIILAVPSHAFHSLLNLIDSPIQGLTWLTKGLDPESHALLSDMVAERFGKKFPVAMLAGPSFANEVALDLPTAITLAGNNLSYLKAVQKLLHHGNIRVYLSEDLKGVQICGAVKNVLAIACGISDGLGYGANAKAALITRGLAEMARLGLALGAEADTFTGLAGLGDLVLTCTDDQSRNRRFGLQLGKGLTPEEAEHSINQVIEGKCNASQVCALAKSYQIEMPICEQVDAILQGKVSAKEATIALMRRPVIMP